jgi:hypothetical protein
VHDSSAITNRSAPSLLPPPSTSRLPVELWGHIGSCLASDGSNIPSLTALRAVCRDAATGLTPLVFRTVVFQDTAPSIERGERVSATRDLGHLASHIRRARCEIKISLTYECALLFMMMASGRAAYSAYTAAAMTMSTLWHVIESWDRLARMDIILLQAPWKALKAILERVLVKDDRTYETRVCNTKHPGCIILQRPPAGEKLPKPKVHIAPPVLRLLRIPVWILWEASLTTLCLSNVIIKTSVLTRHPHLPYKLQHFHLSDCYFSWPNLGGTWSLLWRWMLEDRARNNWTTLKSVVATRCGYVTKHAGVYTLLSLDDMPVETAEKDTEALTRLQAALG